jgi:hypothetical protein
MDGKSISVLAAAAIFVLGVGGVVFAAQDRSTLKVPGGGLAFSEFKGYPSWQPVSVSQTESGIKVIAANDVMMKAFRAGLPADGKVFPEGSKVAKIEWFRRQNKVSPYTVFVPGALKSLSFIEKDSKRFPNTHGWAYAQWVNDPATGVLKPTGTGAECGFACHTRVAAQDYTYTAYPPR